MSKSANFFAGVDSCAGGDWIEQELAASKLPDTRLEKRLLQLVEQMAAGLGRSIPLACQDWAAIKAAYRFFSNERVCEEQILAGHFEATRLSIDSLDQAIEKVQWYALRWKIEIFHKILKSGCRAEQSRLRTTSRLTNLLAVFCILSWRVFWLTMINRVAPEARPELVFTDLELRLLDQLVKAKPSAPPPPPLLSHYLVKLARLGGYLARNSDPPPGNETIWRGLTRLLDIQLGFTIGLALVGN